MSRQRALISTIEPVDGGVPAMTRCITGFLEELGIEPVYAWYAPWSAHPTLSVPLSSLASGRRPGQSTRQAYGAHAGHGLGAWLPELEFTHYLPRSAWRELIEGCLFHLSVTGNPLCAAPFALAGLPFLAWVATPLQADRSERVRSFPLARRLLDRGFNAPVLRRMERRILRAPGGRILALSRYTAEALESIAGRPMDGVLLMPVDTDTYRSDADRVVPWRIGFTGRYADPRKNIDLLLQATRRLAEGGHPVELVLAGESRTDLLLPRLEALGLTARVRCHPSLDPSALAPLLQSLDAFVIPSRQEGLCIAALEAMACGVPVVSTRCGGPEEYVLAGSTGELVDSEPGSMAGALERLCGDRALRRRLGEGAAAWVRSHAGPEAARRTFRRHLAATYPGAVPELEGT